MGQAPQPETWESQRLSSIARDRAQDCWSIYRLRQFGTRLAAVDAGHEVSEPVCGNRLPCACQVDLAFADKGLQLHLEAILDAGAPLAVPWLKPEVFRFSPITAEGKRNEVFILCCISVRQALPGLRRDDARCGCRTQGAGAVVRCYSPDLAEHVEPDQAVAANRGQVGQADRASQWQADGVARRSAWGRCGDARREGFP
jgi:hypothetical protein